MVYNPAIHHRRSIRLKGHDYAGGGLYFVTMCAHRDAGHIFAQEAVREMVARIWEEEAGGRGRTLGPPEQGRTQGPPQLGSPERPAPTSFASTPLPYVVMPDHFHALVRIPVGAGLVSAQGGLVSAQSLGDVVCAFKSRVVNAYIARVKAGEWPPFPGKIWQRDYYERIVRNAEAEEKIGGYIRRNPWRCVMDFGNGLRGMGNPTLWTTEKIGVLASRGGAGGHEARAGGHKARPNEARPNGPNERASPQRIPQRTTPT